MHPDISLRRLRGFLLTATLSCIGASGVFAAPAPAPDTTGTAAVTGAAPATETLLRIRPDPDARGIMAGWTPMFRATLLRSTADSLWVVPLRSGTPVGLALADVRLERYAGRSSLGGAVTGGALGVMLGLGVGLIVAVATNDRHRDNELAGLAFIYLPVTFAGIGLPIGAFVGAIRGADRWERVRLP